MEVVTIKNYYDQQYELEIAKYRLKTLKDKKDLYFQATQPGGVSYEAERVMGGVKNNSLEVYVGKVEDINKNISLVQAEIDILEKNLKCMEDGLRNINGILEQIFVAKYIDGLSINQICKKFHYSRSQVYRKLKIIRKILRN